MQNDSSHVLNLECWPQLAASLINLMDSELTWDEFIRWLHFTLLIFMLIRESRQGPRPSSASESKSNRMTGPLLALLNVSIPTVEVHF